MAGKLSIPIDQLRALLDYDPETGFFTWRVARGTAIKIGDHAGCVRDGKYRYIGIGGTYFKEHRLAWAWMTGVWPDRQIDHRDLDKANNRWLNLRLATNGQNKCNSLTQCNNTSGAKGVSFHKRGRKWQSYINVNGVRITGGWHSTFEEAKAKRDELATIHYGEFARESA